MAAESSKQALEISIPAEEVDKETERVTANLQKRVRLPGFRPGKTPLSIIRTRFETEIRQDVVESLVPKYFRQRVEQDNLRVVGTPDITDVHFHKGEPLRFKVEFEVAPELELKEYRGLTVPYRDPEVTDTDVDARLEGLREQKAEYINVDPRPAADGDYAVVSMETVAGVEGQPIRQDEMTLHLGGERTMPAFTENVRGMSPGDEKEFDVSYPEDYGQERLAGKTVRFRTTLKGIRRKELPELNDEFAADLGDYQNLEELRDMLRKTIAREQELQAQGEAKNKLVDQLVDSHEFPVPETFIERQVEWNLRQSLGELAAQGVDIKKLGLNWEELRKSQRDRALRDVKASLLLDKIADRESIETTMEEVDREVHRLARQQREPAAALRQRLEEDGTLRRIASRIRTEKTLNLLFEQARKVAPETVAPENVAPENADSASEDAKPEEE